MVGPGNEGDLVPSGDFQFLRKPAGDTREDWPWASFETLRTPHTAGIRFFKLDNKTFTYSVKKGFFRTLGLPARIEANLPTACIVAAVVCAANNFGYGPYTTFPLSHHSEPFMPGDRTCNGGAYSFQVPGPLAVADTVVIPMRVHDSASIRCIFAYVQQATTDVQSAFMVKYSRDDGATWQPLEYMGIAQMLPNGAKNTYGFLVEDGYGKPQTRRLPYDDSGIIIVQDVTHGAQRSGSRSYGIRHVPSCANPPLCPARSMASRYTFLVPVNADLNVRAALTVSTVPAAVTDEAPPSRRHWLFSTVRATPGESGPSQPPAASLRRKS